MNRRQFLAAGGLTLLGCSRKTDAPIPPGDLLGPNLDAGHHWRDGKGFPTPTETRRTHTLIVGGGMAGLSCGWWLQRAGTQDFAVLELETEPGGNARSGRNTVSAYPWGAHYLPLPGMQAPELRTMLAEFGALKGNAATEKPEYEDRYVCFAPQERLHINGAWQEGLLPHFGVGGAERTQQQRFITAIQSYKSQRDANGLPPFNIPRMRAGNEDRSLDSLSMRDWLLQQGMTAPTLHWFVNYCCRDDYGTDYSQVSAWAGIHYHASRHGLAANADSDGVLTWPEGNAWLTQRLAASVAQQLQTGAMAWRIAEEQGGAVADVFLLKEGRSVRYKADKLIWAGPTAFLPHAWAEAPSALRDAAARMDHAPWLVANLTLREYPAETRHLALCWDNVTYGTPGLGYVVATHQRLDTQRHDTVFTYYRPLSEYAPAAARKLLLATPREVWAKQILAELGAVHPDLAELTSRIDVWRWGHAMARPTVGMLGGHLDVLRQPHGRVMLAHADLTGFSLAEEAHYWGVRAARWAMDDPHWKEA